MQQSTFRVLVVDDYEPWRRFVTSTLEKQPELQIIGEASDGGEAVEMAQQLYPDLILLDIGLPIVNGLEAARQIRKHAPDTKILFLSENRSAAIAESALSIGASGYVVKAKAATDLVTALKTVLEGKRFVSASLVGHEAGNPTSKHTADKNALVHLPPRNVEIRHEVEFYPDDAAFVAGFAGCIAAVLQAGNSVIVIATEPHRSGILERLEADGVDIRTPAEQERFIELDAHEALSTLMSDDAPDRVRLTKLLDDLVARAAKGRDGEHPRVAICGECAPILLADGKEEAAIQVEHLWDTISKAHRVDTLCGYLRSAFPQAASSPMLEKICAEHSAVHGRKLGY